MRSFLIAVLVLSGAANVYQWREKVADNKRVTGLTAIANSAIRIATERTAEAARCRRPRTMDANTEPTL